MPRKVTPAQIRSKIRQAQREFERDVKRAVDKANRANASRVRANQRRLERELGKLKITSTVTVRYRATYTSFQTVRQSFERLERASELGTWDSDDELFDLVESETANSAALLNALDEDEDAPDDDPGLRQTAIASQLSDISPDFNDRWRGAIYALSLNNPDAARHFCTSSREILVGILDLKAPDDVVRAANPNVALTEQGRVQRREKIRYCLKQSGQYTEEIEEFAEADINNVMDVFGEFNPATHGSAGKYDLARFGALKTRVEGAILFLHRVVTG